MLKISKTQEARLRKFRILHEWRILNVDNLQIYGIFLGSKSSIRATIVRLERENYLQSFCDPETRKKYIFLSKKGENALGIKNYPTALTKRCLRHDAKAVEMALKFFDLENLDLIAPEHKIVDRSQFKVGQHGVPDFYIQFRNDKGVASKIAGELEISRKRKSAISQKLRYYLNSCVYKNVIYFIPNKTVLFLIKRLLKEELKGHSSQKFVFAHHPEMLTNEKLELKDFSWSDLEQEISFKEWIDFYTYREPFHSGNRWVPERCQSKAFDHI